MQKTYVYCPDNPSRQHFLAGRNYLGDDGHIYQVLEVHDDLSFFAKALTPGLQYSEPMPFAKNGICHEMPVRLSTIEVDKIGNVIKDDPEHLKSYAVAAVSMACSFSAISAFIKYDLDSFGISRESFIKCISQAFSEYLNADRIPPENRTAVLEYLADCGELLEQLREENEISQGT